MKTLLTAFLIALTACAAQPAAEAEPAASPETATGGPERACDAAKAQSLLGRSQSPANEAEAKRLSGAGIVRWIPEGGMVTMDYREDRLNLHLDGEGKIIRIECG